MGNTGHRDNEKKRAERFVGFANRSLPLAGAISVCALAAILASLYYYVDLSTSNIVTSILIALAIGPGVIVLVGIPWKRRISLQTLEKSASSSKELEYVRLKLWPNVQSAESRLGKYVPFTLALLVANLVKDIVTLFYGG